MVRIGIDTGGTFTDTVLIANGQIHTTKTPTTPDLISGVLAGFETISTTADILPSDVTQFSHGSTVGLNAILENAGAKTALITTEGFRDVLELREGHRDASLLYNPCGDRPWVPIPRRYRYEVPERITANGEIKTPLSESAIDDVIDNLLAAGIESVAVCLLHAHRNPVHETTIAARLHEHAPSIDVSISSAVSPEIREYSRTATTAVDAFIRPIVSSYITTLESSLRERELDAPITIMTSDGGVVHPELATDRPITQLLSGPVGGVNAAQTTGRSLGFPNLLTLDMGGTSCDTAIITGGAPIEESHRTIHGVKLNGPFVAIETVGAGGGSIARTTEEGSLRVGPRSAGADPGPACYGRGGSAPTVTDADLVLGLLNPTEFADGAITLDPAAAHDAISTVAEPLGMSVTEAALAVRNIIDTKLASAIRVVSMQAGHDPRDFALMGFGGAGPAHACAVGEELGTDTIIFPANPGLLSSAGLLVTDIEHNHVQSLVTTIAETAPDEIDAAVQELIDRGASELAIEHVPVADRAYTVSFDMMYVGQAHYLTIPFGTVSDPEATTIQFTRENAQRLRTRFETEHDHQYGFTDERNDIELVNVRVTARGAIDTPTLSGNPTGGSIDQANQGTREVVIDRETTIATPYYAWNDLPPRTPIETPAIIESSNTTMWLPPSTTAELDATKNVIVHRGDDP